MQYRTPFFSGLVNHWRSSSALRISWLPGKGMWTKAQTGNNPVICNQHPYASFGLPTLPGPMTALIFRAPVLFLDVSSEFALTFWPWSSSPELSHEPYPPALGSAITTFHGPILWKFGFPATFFLTLRFLLFTIVGTNELSPPSSCLARQGCNYCSLPVQAAASFMASATQTIAR